MGLSDSHTLVRLHSSSTRVTNLVHWYERSNIEHLYVQKNLKKLENSSYASNAVFTAGLLTLEMYSCRAMECHAAAMSEGPAYLYSLL